MNALEFIEVRKEYGGREALAGISMTVPEGEFVVMMGPSGSGKTTLLKTANRLVEPSGGKVFFFGEDSARIEKSALRRQIGYALQSTALFPHMTVAKNIAAVPELLGWSRSEIDERVRELISAIGLDPKEHAERYPSQLSGGQAQRVGIARALAGRPRLLLLDEPFASLDAIIRTKLQDDLLEMHKRHEAPTVLFVTHDPDEAFRLGQRIAILDEGRLIRYATPSELIDDPGSDLAARLLGLVSAEGMRRARSTA